MSASENVRSTRAGSVLMLFTLISRILGFVRIITINAIFGASGKADVLNAVFNIPNNLRKLLAEGALSSAFIPVLTKSYVLDQSGKTGRDIVKQLIGFQLLVIIPVILVSVLFSQSIVPFILDFPEPEKTTLAIQLFRFMIIYILPISISALIMGSLNSRHHFTIPAITPLLFSICTISSILIFHRTMGIFSIALGVLTGGLAQVVFQLPKFAQFSFSLLPSFNFRSNHFRAILRQWLPVVATASVFTINQQVAIFFASGLEDGSVSALHNAIVFWQLPFGVFSASIATVLFPRMSKQAGLKDFSALNETVTYGIRYLIILLIPSSLVLGYLANEIIIVALLRGAFTFKNAQLSAFVLQYYCLGMLFVGLFNFLQRYFYSLGDYKTPFVTAILLVTIDILLSVYLKETSLGVAGLALANSISFFIASLGLIIKIQLGNNVISIIKMRRTLIKTSVVTLVLFAYLFAFSKISSPLWNTGSTFLNFIVIIIGGLISIIITGAGYWILNVDIIRSMLSGKGVK